MYYDDDGGDMIGERHYRWLLIGDGRSRWSVVQVGGKWSVWLVVGMWSMHWSVLHLSRQHQRKWIRLEKRQLILALPLLHDC